MIDGLSADAFAKHRCDLPSLDALAARGTVVNRLGCAVPGTSLPGRVGIVTGVGPEIHGVYGNRILDGRTFRYANPDDVRVPTVAGRARAAGSTVAVLGYGMVRPEEADVFHHAWWANEMLQRGRDDAPEPADEGWSRTVRHGDPSGRLEALAREGYPRGVPDAYAGDRAHYLVAGMEGDRRVVRWAGGLATAPDPVDLIVTEILTPDTVLHANGTDDPLAIWSLSYADALVGMLVHHLERHGALDDTTIVVTSDHGHGPVDAALHLERIVPNLPTASEGTIAFVATSNDAERSDATARLAEHGVAPLDGSFLPPDVADHLAAFVAPDGTSFERAVATGGATGDATGDAVRSAPRYRSMHGFRPGHPSDERFLVAVGPSFGVADLATAPSNAVEATLAHLVGLSPFGEGTPLTYV